MSKPILELNRSLADFRLPFLSVFSLCNSTLNYLNNSKLLRVSFLRCLIFKVLVALELLLKTLSNFLSLFEAQDVLYQHCIIKSREICNFFKIFI